MVSSLDLKKGQIIINYTNDLWSRTSQFTVLIFVNVIQHSIRNLQREVEEYTEQITITFIRNLKGKQRQNN